MKKRIPSPFPEPTSLAWRRSLKETYRINVRLYALMVFILILPAVIYYIISWSISIEERSQLGPGNFYMVSFADIYTEVESISEAWSNDAELLEAQTSVYPSLNDVGDDIWDRKGIGAFFRFRSLNEVDDLYLVVRYQNGEYAIRSSHYVKGKEIKTMIQTGNATPLPEAFGFQDSLLAFEALYPSFESSIMEDYLDIHWPMKLNYWPDADGGEWELTYTLKEP